MQLLRSYHLAPVLMVHGEASGDCSVRVVNLSSDGKTVAIGAPDNYGNGLIS